MPSFKKTAQNCQLQLPTGENCNHEKLSTTEVPIIKFFLGKVSNVWKKYFEKTVGVELAWLPASGVSLGPAPGRIAVGGGGERKASLDVIERGTSG